MSRGWLKATRHDAPRGDGVRTAPPGERPRPSRLAASLSLVLRAAALFGALTLGRATIADQYEVPTGSMAPSIEPGDHIFVDKTAYGLRLPFVERRLWRAREPRAGDVVVFADPRGGATTLVKRVVALPGQTVAVRGGLLYVDDRPQRLEQRRDGAVVEHLGPVAHETGSRDFEDFGPVVVPPDHLFMMGDNRASSLDSRILGAVPESLVRGRVVGTLFRYLHGFDASRVLHRIE